MLPSGTSSKILLDVFKIKSESDCSGDDTVVRPLVVALILGTQLTKLANFLRVKIGSKKLSSCILFFCFIVVKILSLQFLWHLRFVECAWISHVMTLSSSSLKSWGKAHTQVFLRLPTSLKTWSSESNQWGHAVAWELAHLSDFYIKKGKGVKNVIGKSFSANWQLWSSNSYGW